MKATTSLAFLLLSLCCASTVAHADTIGIEFVTIPTVPIGNPGNAADRVYVDRQHPNGVGSVAYPFNIGKTEVTNSQYVAFLNAVAASDPYGLYSTGMAANSEGGIVRNGESGSFTYAVKAPALSGAYRYENKPVVCVSWGDATRFANWLHNGQPTGAESVSTTEDGAYTLHGAITDAALNAVTRNPGARWWLPSEDEWYKAAYYNPHTNLYYDYPTGTNFQPNNNLPAADTGNSANFDNIGYTAGKDSYPMTDAGAYTLSGSPYGTFDQGGNVSEWNDTLLDGSYRDFRGGSFYSGYTYVRASRWQDTSSTDKPIDLGFRVANSAIPEPSTLLLGVMASLGMLARKRR